MKKILLMIMGGLLLAGTAFAQEARIPLLFETRLTFAPSIDPAKSFDAKPTIGVVTDGLWGRVNLLGAYTSGGLTSADTSSSLEIGAVVEIRKWISQDGKRSFSLQGNVGTDVIKANLVGRRVYALGGVLDAGWISGMNFGVRVAWVNQDTALDDWGAQVFFQFDPN